MVYLLYIDNGYGLDFHTGFFETYLHTEMSVDVKFVSDRLGNNRKYLKHECKDDSVIIMSIHTGKGYVWFTVNNHYQGVAFHIPIGTKNNPQQFNVAATLFENKQCIKLLSNWQCESNNTIQSLLSSTDRYVMSHFKSHTSRNKIQFDNKYM